MFFFLRPLKRLVGEVAGLIKEAETLSEKVRTMGNMKLEDLQAILS